MKKRAVELRKKADEIALEEFDLPESALQQVRESFLYSKVLLYLTFTDLKNEIISEIKKVFARK